ncbi:MAG: RsmB/NOP family class I SAM-dependent RNA methyltransferase [Micavibrio aeruginosavorus]|uniref:RsmB/NOP family class I SAM-dependent RNA methyltransferase n=1 Tax=Micavibrio aeruginosavorus TaxID=349221 RepID=A0A2W5FT34_9BACT|nr:MAG: RsmB/NOP family class I SAM-dependent RNA methyltransferase [Micavibrio aeruginosavorus]
MTPAARIKAVLEILERLNAMRVPMDASVGDYMRFRKYIGSKDRNAIVEKSYGIMRHWARLDWHIERAGMEINPRTILIAYLALVEKDEKAPEHFDGSKYGAENLSEGELKLFDELLGVEIEPADMPAAVRVECPSDYEETLRNYFGGEFESELAAMIDPAPLTLRVNVTMAAREKVKAKLADDKVEVEETQYSPWGLRAKEKSFISKTRAFVKGWIDIQDEGSQLIALACDAKPGMQVMDYCAGAAGKTLALANAMAIKGRIVAMDTEAARLEKGRERLRRAYVTDIIEIRPLSDEKHAKWFRKQKQNFDVVLTDVPCSGTGTWRRNPDMRWRSFGPKLEELIVIQADIMDKVVHAIKPGGRLVYATCSILPEENEQQVEKFLERHPDFKLLPLAEAWPEGLKIPCEGDVMRLTPKRHNTDGFFTAILQRQ